MCCLYGAARSYEREAAQDVVSSGGRIELFRTRSWLILNLSSIRACTVGRDTVSTQMIGRRSYDSPESPLGFDLCIFHTPFKTTFIIFYFFDPGYQDIENFQVRDGNANRQTCPLEA